MDINHQFSTNGFRHVRNGWMTIKYSDVLTTMSCSRNSCVDVWAEVISSTYFKVHDESKLLKMYYDACVDLKLLET